MFTEPIVVKPREVASEVAYGKRTKQSSDYYFYASAAVDGNLDTSTHTGLDTAPYWEVDLGKEYNIERIEIFNRKGCCGEYCYQFSKIIDLNKNFIYIFVSSYKTLITDNYVLSIHICQG